MSRTFKDRKDHIQYKKRRAEPLKQKFISYLHNGPQDQIYVSPARDEYLFEDDGDRCPCCDAWTDFESGFLVCNECGWMDFDEVALLPKAAA